MSTGQIPAHIRRFVLTSIDSVSHLEAIILLKTNPDKDWDARGLAQSLFLSEKKAGELLEDLAKSNFVSVKNAAYFYAPGSNKLKELLDELVGIYPRNLIEVTNLIHSNVGKQAQRFGDAFKLKDDRE